MRHIFYFLAILILSFLIACSEEPPTSTELVSQSKSESFSKKPKPPQPQEPLVLLDTENQIVAYSLSGRGKHKKSIIKVWTDHTRTWTLEKPEVKSVAIGDADNDGNDELVAVSNDELQIFENGDTDEPSRLVNISSAGSVWDVVVGELGGNNVILVGGRTYVQVWTDDGDNLTNVWQFAPNDQPWSVEIGDANSDSNNEIVFSSFSNGCFVVLDYPNYNPTYSDPVFGALDRAKVADVDGDGINEVIGGGSDSKLYVWEYANGNYNLSFVSSDLGGFTQGVAAGDFDADGENEIGVGTAGSTNKIRVFKYSGSTNTYLSIFEEAIAGLVNDMFAGDSDNDGIDEIVVSSTESLLVYGFDEGTESYSQVYSDPEGALDVYVK